MCCALWKEWDHRNTWNSYEIAAELKDLNSLDRPWNPYTSNLQQDWSSWVPWTDCWTTQTHSIHFKVESRIEGAALFRHSGTTQTNQIHMDVQETWGIWFPWTDCGTTPTGEVYYRIEGSELLGEIVGPSKHKESNEIHCNIEGFALFGLSGTSWNQW